MGAVRVDDGIIHQAHFQIWIRSLLQKLGGCSQVVESDRSVKGGPQKVAVLIVGVDEHGLRVAWVAVKVCEGFPMEHRSINRTTPYKPYEPELLPERELLLDELPELLELREVLLEELLELVLEELRLVLPEELFEPVLGVEGEPPMFVLDPPWSSLLFDVPVLPETRFRSWLPRLRESSGLESLFPILTVSPVLREIPVELPESFELGASPSGRLECTEVCRKPAEMSGLLSVVFPIFTKPVLKAMVMSLFLF